MEETTEKRRAEASMEEQPKVGVVCKLVRAAGWVVGAGGSFFAGCPSAVSGAGGILLAPGPPVFTTDQHSILTTP